MSSRWDLPPPWSRRVTHPIGGLTDVGASPDGRFLLVVSHQGRGVYELSHGTRVARDPADVPEIDRDDDAHTVRGIGPLSSQQVSVAGLWGGTLAPATADGWSVMRINPNQFRLAGPGCDHRLPAFDTDLRLVGFVASGNVLVYACSSDVTLWFRERAV